MSNAHLTYPALFEVCGFIDDDNGTCTLDKHMQERFQRCVDRHTAVEVAAWDAWIAATCSKEERQTVASGEETEVLQILTGCPVSGLHDFLNMYFEEDCYDDA